MKKHNLFEQMNVHDKLELQLQGLHKLLGLAGCQLDSDLHMACMSICVDLDTEKTKRYRTLTNAVMELGE